jgi:bifunctional enzyme CysN/CysC
MVEAGEFIEVFVDTPIEDCIARDPKGLYAKAKAGLIKNFTGIDSPYERPGDAELVLDTQGVAAEVLATKVLAVLVERGIVET